MFKSISGSRARRTIILAGFVAGTLDILAAFTSFYLNTGKNPLIILRYIAGKLIGKDAAYAGGAEMLLLGLLMHYLIAFTFTIFFFWLYPRIKFLSKSVILTTFIFGIIAWVVMNLIMLPLFVHTPFHPAKWINPVRECLILVCMIGLPVTLFAKNYYSRFANP